MKTAKTETDEAVVERARRARAVGRRLRWNMLLLACMFLGLCGWWALKVVDRLDRLGPEEVSEGFVAGFALGIACSTLGVIGGLYLAKFLIGFSGDFRAQELLVRYHDRLRKLVGDDLK